MALEKEQFEAWADLIAKANDEELDTIWEKVRLDYETSSKAVRERYITLGKAIRARNEELRKEAIDGS